VFESRIEVCSAQLACLDTNWPAPGDTGAAKAKYFRSIGDVLLPAALKSIATVLPAPPPGTVGIPQHAYLTYTPSKSQPVGIVRHSALRMLGALLQGAYVPSFEQQIIASRVVPLALDIFFSHTHVYFAHQVIADLIVMPLLHGSSAALLAHTLLDAQLLERIISNYQSPHSTRSSDASTWTSYSGFLSNIANSIEMCKILDKCAATPAPLKQQWRNFIDDTLNPSEY
jgi:hypothetical protein